MKLMNTLREKLQEKGYNSLYSWALKNNYEVTYVRTVVARWTGKETKRRMNYPPVGQTREILEKLSETIGESLAPRWIKL